MLIDFTKKRKEKNEIARPYWEDIEALKNNAQNRSESSSKNTDSQQEQKNEDEKPIAPKQKPAEPKPAKPKSIGIRIFKFFSYSLAFIIVFFFAFAKLSAFSNNSFIENFGRLFSFKYLFGQKSSLIGAQNDRVNILLLGIAGKNHDGPNLTDTIMLASIQPSTKKISLLSLPRDLIVNLDNYGYRKINSANAYAEAANQGSGGDYSRQVIGELLGQEIPYYIRVDFKGFEKIIDELGGVKINVEKSFTDNYYPDENYGYEALNFTAGEQTMDGSRALKYVRSRHGTNGEGSDFSRAGRQQKVLEAIKDKAISFSLLLNPYKIANLLSTFQDYSATNLSVWDLIDLAKTAKDIKKENISRQVVDASQNGLLYETITEEGAYILLPKVEDYSELKELAKNIFELPGQNQNESLIKIEVQNGTKTVGLAGEAANRLRKLGYDVIRIRNAQKQNFEKTAIYDLTNGQKNEILAKLRDELSADVFTELPSWFTEENNQDNPPLNAINADFLIIVGKSQEQ